jgi:tetratricopeptide (TPR) repeat protein
MKELLNELETYQSKVLARQAIAAAWQEDPNKREQSLKDVILRYPTNTAAYLNLASLYAMRFEYSSAVHVLEQGRSSCRPCGELLFNLARCYAQRKQFERAIETLELARQLKLPEKLKDRTTSLLKEWSR